MVTKYLLILLTLIFFYSFSSSNIIGEEKKQDVSLNTAQNTGNTSEVQIEIVKLFNHEIIYTQEGYSPNSITINIGETIGFVNKSNIPMWTASDPHPIHSDYALFDSLKSYNRDEIYTLTYNESGSYGFHNHEKSLHRGIIQVIDPKNPKPNIDKTKKSQRELRDNLLKILDRENPKSIFTLIDKIEADNKLSRNCHDMAHDLGHKSYELFGFSTAMTFSDPESASHTSIDDICAGGYMHGILEELFLHHPELKTNPEKVCSTIPKQHKESCFHGVGHGLMFANLRSVEKSLLSCRVLSTPTFTYRCFEGVWMEMFWGNIDHSGANSLGWDLDQPFASCKNAESDEKPTCYLYAHLGYLRTHPRNYEGVVHFCTQENLPEIDSMFCIKGIGITMMKHFTSNHLEHTEILVKGLSLELKKSYYSGVIGYSFLSGIEKTNLKNFCNTLKNDTKICLEVLDESE